METITEKTDSELIAQFMGHVLLPDGWVSLNGTSNHIHRSSLDYHYSWNALMPVLEKIEQFKFDDGELDEGDEPDTAFLRTFKGGMVRINRFSLHHCETKIQAAHMAVVEFIRWYNGQKK